MMAQSTEEIDGCLQCRTPVTFATGVRQLQRETGLAADVCAAGLKAVLDAGNAARTDAGEPLFAFRLHQWLASGRSIFATLQQSHERLLTTEGQYKAPGSQQRLLYPLAFCRECGQEYYQVSRVQIGGQSIDEGGNLDNVIRPMLIPRSPLVSTRNASRVPRPIRPATTWRA